MTANALEKARAAAEKAAQDLAALESAEAEKAAQAAAQRLEREKAAAVRFLADLPGLEVKVKGEKPTAAEMATALENGTLGVLVADFLARRDALQVLRDHARQCARLLDQDENRFTDIRYVDPAEELRRWQEVAITEIRRVKADVFAANALSAYEVA
ncbi:hypothetical protein ACLF6K_24170 [Streptomyces xanthophaeus]|uniref:hypothetical protein n=1 Tax=Streptomyces xanthophaeus TaxID=67385 RepID=UPI00398F902A